MAEQVPYGSERHSSFLWGNDAPVFATVTVVAALLRFYRLSDPEDEMFDEVYYANDACWYAFGPDDPCDGKGPPTEVHPPLGKWLLAAGIRLFGYESFGWRVAAALAGAATVALLFLLARKVLGSTAGATVAAGLLAFDPLHFVQSRVAMLEIFVPLFGVAALLFAALDRDRGRDPPSLWRRPWRAAAGLALGAAAASKWSGLLFLPAVLLLTTLWDIGARRERGLVRALGGFLRHELTTVVLYLVVLPAALYAVTYAGHMNGDLLAAPWSDGSWFRNLWNHQSYMYDFHSNLEASHSYQSPAWSWTLLKRPVSYFFETTDNGDYREVLATGSPLAWWGSLLALVYVAVALAWRRLRHGGEGVILAGFAFTYLPWLVLPSGREATFIFYLTPALPFMALALGYVAARLWPPVWGKAAVAVFSVGAVGLFFFYYPVLSNIPVPRDQWEQRIWIFDDCETPKKRPAERTVTRTRGKRTVTRTRAGKEEPVPPEGWCWI
jgi:dolichyl-phosphate-mannose-protein mannosyltransferase